MFEGLVFWLLDTEGTNPSSASAPLTAAFRLKRGDLHELQEGSNREIPNGKVGQKKQQPGIAGVFYGFSKFFLWIWFFFGFSRFFFRKTLPGFCELRVDLLKFGFY